MNDDIPTIEEFNDCIRKEFSFLISKFGFRVSKIADEDFLFIFEKAKIEIHIKGEGYGTMASCDIYLGSKRCVSPIFLVPQAERPKRSKKREKMGQLEQIREYSHSVSRYCTDVLNGDTSRLEQALDEWERMTDWLCRQNDQ